MITLAIDGSTHSSGIAVFDQGKLIQYKCINSDDPIVFNRIQQMVNEIKKICIQYNPTDIIMQDVLPEDVKRNQSTFKALIYLQALVVLELYKNNFKVNFYTASHWRAQVGIKVGSGIKRNELKKASIKLVKNIYNIDVNDDISDAICLGIAYIKQNRKPF